MACRQVVAGEHDRVVAARGLQFTECCSPGFRLSGHDEMDSAVDDVAGGDRARIENAHHELDMRFCVQHFGELERVTVDLDRAWLDRLWGDERAGDRFPKVGLSSAISARQLWVCRRTIR